MTTELEQEFFRVFGIEPKWKDKRVKNEKTYYTEEQAEYLRRTTKNRNIQLCYPKITAEKLLEMICIVMKYKNIYRFVNGIEDLKEQTFKILISLKDMLSIYAEIQQLFKD